jgi:membrane-bound lytic murein transglycosylase A
MRKNILLLSVLIGLVFIFSLKYFFKTNLVDTTNRPVESQTKPIQKFTELPAQQPRMVSKHNLKKVDFSELGNWNRADLLGSLDAFKQSCQLWKHMEPSHSIGNSQIPMTVKDWLPVCDKVLAQPKNISKRQAKLFFETYFQPFHWKNFHSGRFTGYYSPTVAGSKTPTADYKTPLYSKPNDLISAHVKDFDSKAQKHTSIYGRLIGSHIKPYYSRQEIYQGAIKHKAKIVAWLKSPLDAMLLEIEGSGVVETPNGEQIFVGYEAENGRKYRSIAQLLINNRIFDGQKASIDSMKKYFSAHPTAISKYVGLNPSFVFFSRYTHPNFKGAQNVVLTPKYSLAVDKRYIPYGIPLFLKTKCPVNTAGQTKELDRVMVAQDTGGAIRGPIRGDIYWGTGHHAMKVANLMSHSGDFWFLLPKHFRLV